MIRRTSRDSGEAEIVDVESGSIKLEGEWEGECNLVESGMASLEDVGFDEKETSMV